MFYFRDSFYIKLITLIKGLDIDKFNNLALVGSLLIKTEGLAFLGVPYNIGYPNLVKYLVGIFIYKVSKDSGINIS